MSSRALVACLALASPGCQLHFGPHETPHAGPALETVLSIEAPMPTTLAVAPSGRLFVNFPNWWDQPPFAVAEVVAGKLRPYPKGAWNRWNGEPGAAASRAFVCVQAVYVDGCGKSLWVVDSGNPLRLSPGTVAGGPKLVQIDLGKNRVTRVIAFDAGIAPEDSYLNDVRIDHRTATAYLTDSGTGAIVVVDLERGTSRRLLSDHPSTKAEGCVVPRVGGAPWRTFLGVAPRIHADGLALSPDGAHLYYRALTARTLYRVPTAVLRDAGNTAEEIGEAVEVVATTSATDGMWMDHDGSLYMTAIEHDAIERRTANGKLETVVRDGLIQWPDAVVVHHGASKSHVYFTASQIHKSWPFQNGVSTRVHPYQVFRVSIARPAGEPADDSCD
jgi:sugar lactone lactonase YvrE